MCVGITPGVIITRVTYVRKFLSGVGKILNASGTGGDLTVCIFYAITTA